MPNDNCGLSLLDLSWNDILIPHILPNLNVETLFALRCVSTTSKELITEYFKVNLTLDLSCFEQVPLDALEILTKDARHLRYLNLNNCKLLDDSMLISIFQNNNRLVSVDLSSPCSSSLLTIRCIQPLIINCLNLKELKVQHCMWVTRGCLESLTFHHSKLQLVDFGYCYELGDTILQHFLAKFTNLRSVSLNSLVAITDQTLNAIAKHTKSLEHLDVGGCPHVTEWGIQSVMQSCQQLRSLCVGVRVPLQLIQESQGRLRVDQSHPLKIVQEPYRVKLV